MRLHWLIKFHGRHFNLCWCVTKVLLLLNACVCLLCRYIGFRYPDGTSSKFYWHLVTLKLAFVILFEVSTDDFVANFNSISILESMAMHAYLGKHFRSGNESHTDCNDLLSRESKREIHLLMMFDVFMQGQETRKQATNCKEFFLFLKGLDKPKIYQQ